MSKLVKFSDQYFSFLEEDMGTLTESSNMGVTGNTVYEFWFCWFMTQPGNGSIRLQHGVTAF